jgi:DNA-binding transcriptional regulator YiaG
MTEIVSESEVVQVEKGIVRTRFHSKLNEAEAKGLKLLADALESYDEQSEEDFADVIDAVIRNRFSPTEISNEFKVSVSTVSRWKDRRSCPPAYARRVIVDKLREMLVASIGIRQRNLEIVG